MSALTGSRRPSALTVRLIEAVKWNSIARVFDVAVRIASSLIVARGLGVRLYGVNVSVNSLLMLLPLFLSFGFEQTVQVFVARWMAPGGERERARTLVRRLVAWRLVIYGSAGAGLFLAARFIAGWVQEEEVTLFLRLMAPAMIISGAGAIYANVSQGRLQVRGLMIYGMVMQVTGIVAAVFILRAGWGIAGLLAWTITAATMNLCFFTANANRMLPRETAPIEIRPVLRVAGAAWISLICAQLLQKEMDVLVLNVFRIPWEAIAAYNLGASLGLTLGSLANGTGSLFQGALSEAAQRVERRPLGAIWQAGIKTSAVLWVPPLFFVFVFAPELIIAFWGPGFREAAWVFRMMALPQVSAALLGEAFAGSLFFAVGRERLALVLRLMAVGLNVTLDFALIPQFGIVGAMIGTSTAFAAVAIAEMSFVYRLTGVLPPIRFLGKWLAAFGLAGLSAVLVPGVGWGVWAGRLVVYTVVAVSLLRIFRPLEAEERELLMRHVPAGRWVFANL